MKRFTQFLGVSLSLVMLANSVGLTALAQSPVLNGDIRVTVTPADIQKSLPVTGADRTVNMTFHGVSIQDALKALAKQGGFNVLMDESVQGNISVDLNNVTIQDALDTIRSYGNLAYSVQGGNLMVAEAASSKGQSFKRAAHRIIPLRYANATMMANLLNRTLFADRIPQGAAGGGGGAAPTSGGAGGNGGTSATPGGGTILPMPVTADTNTNSLIVVGTAADLKTVAEHVDVLDAPRESKTWRLSHANALDVMGLLQASLFYDGQSAQNPTTIPVVAETVKQDESTSRIRNNMGSTNGGTTEPLVSNILLKAKVKENGTLPLYANGAILIPDTRLNTVTLMGTAEQIAMAEAMIPTWDRKLPQVVLEASLIEITEDANKNLGFNAGGTFGRFSFGSNNVPGGDIANNPFNNVIGRRTSSKTPLESIARITNSPLAQAPRFFYQLNALLASNKAKILANPTVVTTSDSESVVSIVDEVIRSVEVTIDQTGDISGTEAIIGDVGIVLNMLPKVGADGSVNLRVRPIVSTVREVREDVLNNKATLLSKRELLAQNVTLKDGESFVLGGLVQDTNTQALTQIPGIGNMPILGALGRNSTRNKHRSELVVVITPHIMNDESEVARQTNHDPMVPATLSKNRPLSETGILPVSNTGLRNAKRDSLPPLQPVEVMSSPEPLKSSEAPTLRLSPNSQSKTLAPEVSIANPVRHNTVAFPMSNGNYTADELAEKLMADDSGKASKSEVKTSLSDDRIRALLDKYKKH